MIKEAIVKIVNKEDLSYDEAYQVMNEIMSGETTPTQNAAFLAALSTKSARAETTDEIAGCAAAMREHATKVEAGMDLFEISGFHFKPIKSTNDHRPYRIKCIETLDEKDSALSYQDAANLLITPILFVRQKLTDDSQNMNYVRTVFEKVLIG